MQFNKETPEAIVRQQLPVTRKLVLPIADLAFGKIDVAAWKQIEEIMLDLADEFFHQFEFSDAIG